MIIKESNTDIKPNIFEECKYDIDIFLEKYPESRDLTMIEVKTINALCDTAIKFGFDDEILLGTGRSSCLGCIFKINDGSWIIWETDERRGFNQAKQFDNITNACIGSIIRNMKFDSINSEIAYFNSLLDQDTPTTYLSDFANQMGYTFISSKGKILKKI